MNTFRIIFKHNLKHTLTILVLLSLSVCILSFIANPVFAAETSDNITETTFFGNLKDDGQGCGIFTVLNLVVDILSIGIGILGVIGITVAGIQYLTAKDNESQVQKSKRRIGEVIIGLIAFTILYVFVQWLLPGGKLSSNTSCATVSNQDLAEMQAAANANNGANSNNNTPASSNNNPSNSVKNTAPYLKASKFNRECLTSDKYNTTGEKISCILNKISIWADKHNVHYGNKAWRGKNTLMNCATFTTAAYIEAGLLKKGDYFALAGNDVQNWKAVKKRGTLVKTDVPDGTKVKTLVKQGKLLPGDTIGLKTHHTYMYIGRNSSGKYVCQQLGRGQTIFDDGSHQHSKSKFSCGNKAVYMIVHPKRSITISL